MNRRCGYLRRIFSSWRIPAFALLVIAIHLIVETLVQAGFSRFTLFLFSSLISPLLVNVVMRERRLWWGALINGAGLLFSLADFTLKNGLEAAGRDLLPFLLVLAFSIACGACAGGFYVRLCRKFGRAT